MTDDQLQALHDCIQFMLWGMVDTSAQSRADFVAAVHGGQTVESIITGWMANPQHAAWQKLLATLAGLDANALAVLTSNLRSQVAAIKSLG